MSQKIDTDGNSIGAYEPNDLRDYWAKSKGRNFPRERVHRLDYNLIWHITEMQVKLHVQGIFPKQVGPALSQLAKELRLGFSSSLHRCLISLQPNPAILGVVKRPYSHHPGFLQTFFILPVIMRPCRRLKSYKKPDKIKGFGAQSMEIGKEPPDQYNRPGKKCEEPTQFGRSDGKRRRKHSKVEDFSMLVGPVH
jgi:hypothetical protein